MKIDEDQGFFLNAVAISQPSLHNSNSSPRFIDMMCTIVVFFQVWLG